LRPLTEFAITKEFVQHPEYFPHFTSCNTAFRIDRSKPENHWCGVCPKCAFVFLLLSAYLPEKTTESIFHKNLFSDSSLIPLYEELCGIRGIKPFECVGTPEESAEAFRRAAAAGRWKDSAVMNAILPQLRKNDQKNSESLFLLSADHAVPDKFMSVLQGI
jgi:hypothetical protein